MNNLLFKGKNMLLIALAALSMSFAPACVVVAKSPNGHSTAAERRNERRREEDRRRREEDRRRREAERRRR